MPDIGSAPNKSYQRSDGVRTGGEIWQESKAATIAIRADFHDAADQDMADAISNRLMKDGGNAPTAALPMGGFRHTGVGNANARTNYASAADVQDGSLIYAATSSNDTITASLSPAITTYATGALYLLKAGGTNTGAATVNLNSSGAKTVKKGKTGSLDLSAGDFAAGRMGLFAYDGTNLQLLNAPEFPTGTKMIFWQTSAPTGWTKDTNHNDKALRITSGTASTGGTVAFETAFASKTPTGTVGNTSIAITGYGEDGDIPGPSNSLTSGKLLVGSGSVENQETLESVTGANAAPTHTHTWTGDAINLDVSFVDVILATKD